MYVPVLKSSFLIFVEPKLILSNSLTDREILLNFWEQVKVLGGDAFLANNWSAPWSQCSAENWERWLHVGSSNSSETLVLHRDRGGRKCSYPWLYAAPNLIPRYKNCFKLLLHFSWLLGHWWVGHCCSEKCSNLKSTYYCYPSVWGD